MSTHAEALAVPTWRQPLRRIEWLLDHSSRGQSVAGSYMRNALGALFLLYGTALLAIGILHDDLRPTPLFFVLFSVPLFTNKLGIFGRYFLPVFLGLFAYATATSYATRLKLPVYYTPQIDLERHLTGGLPTIWLQHLLYRGHTGPLEAACVFAYAGHFLIPLALGAAMLLSGRRESFTRLMFAILAASMIAMIVFVVAPTAPPWLASEQGYIGGVHHILKSALYDVHMSTLAAAEGDSSKYDVTAAFPSLHTTFPLLCLLAARHARMPRPVRAFLVANFCLVVFAIVYTGEHYLVDALAGALLALLAWRLVSALYRRRDVGSAALPVPSAG